MQIKKLFSLKKYKHYNKIKEIKKIVILLLINFIFLFLWVNRNKLYPENIFLYLESKIKAFSVFDYGFPKNIEGELKNSENLKILGENILILSNNSFNVLTKSGKLLRSERHNLSNPYFKTKGARSILYQVGGKDFKIESFSKTLFKSTAEKNITSCDIAENGTYAILTESQSFLSEISIFNNKNEEKYKYCFSKIYATDVEINNKANGCAVSGISFEDGNINSDIYILNFKSEKPESVFKLENNIVKKIMYFANGNILTIGNNYISVINPKLGSIKNYLYEYKFLKYYSFSPEYGVCCCFSPSMNKNQDDEIILIDTFGKNIRTIKTKENLKGVSHFKNRILGFTNSKILSYSLEGRFEGYINLKSIFNKIVLSSDSLAYAVGDTEIDIIKIKNLKKD